MIIDPKTGNPIELEDGDGTLNAELPSGGTFWAALDRRLVGARSETGYLIPSELEDTLDRIGIQDEENRATARRLLDELAAGRIEADREAQEKRREEAERKRRT